MAYLRQSVIGISVATASLLTWAQSASPHKDHHPAGAAPTAAAVQDPSAATVGPDKMAAMDQHMKAMQSMHEKMMAAKTPEDRQALMAEHMKVMQDGMSLMKGMVGPSGMGGGMMAGKDKRHAMGERHQLMEKRMEMMEFMMQMMMDRIAVVPTK